MLFPCFSDTHASAPQGRSSQQSSGSAGLVRHRCVNTSVLVSGPTLPGKLFFHNLFFIFRNKMKVVRRLKCLHICSYVNPVSACAAVLRSVVLEDGGAIVCNPSRGSYPSSNVCSALGHAVPPFLPEFSWLAHPYHWHWWAGPASCTGSVGACDPHAKGHSAPFSSWPCAWAVLAHVLLCLPVLNALCISLEFIRLFSCKTQCPLNHIVQHRYE